MIFSMKKHVLVEFILDYNLWAKKKSPFWSTNLYIRQKALQAPVIWSRHNAYDQQAEINRQQIEHLEYIMATRVQMKHIAKYKQYVGS